MDYQSPTEAARVAVTRYMQREGQVWVRIFPDKPITKNLLKYVGRKGTEGFVAPVTREEFCSRWMAPYEVAKEALRLAAQKLPVTTKFVVRRDYVNPKICNDI